MKWLLVAACFAPGPGALLYASCHVPRYGVGKIVENTSSTVLITVSVGRFGFSPNRLTCLVEHLRHKYPGRDLLSILFFDSHEAAVNYRPGTTDLGAKAVEYQTQMHALYALDTSKHEDYLLLLPDPLIQDPLSPLNTRIDFPVAGASSCKLQIDNRCLIAFGHLLYPWQDGKAEVSGDVTVTGTIGRDGIVTKIAVADARVDPANQKQLLVDATVDHLKTWRFVGSGRRNAIRITYSYELLPSQALRYKTDVQFALPGRITIKTSVVP